VQGPIERALGIELEDTWHVGTGYGRVTLPFPKEHIRSEILCHGLGAHMMYPGTRTVLDIGGQDTKGIQVDANGIVENFQMNDRCAAGCGRYLGYIADEMNIGLHELGPLAMQSEKPARINSTCTVFAGAELRDRLALGEKREDIIAGLHRAIILRAMSIISRSGGVPTSSPSPAAWPRTRRRCGNCRSWSSRTTATSPSTSIRTRSTPARSARPNSPAAPRPARTRLWILETQHDPFSRNRCRNRSGQGGAVFGRERRTTPWLARYMLRIRNRDPFELAAEAYDQMLEEAGLKRSEMSTTWPPPAKARRFHSTPATSTR
jgi:hypothetical protein